MTDEKNTEQHEERFDLKAAGKELFKALENVEKLRQSDVAVDLAALDDALTELCKSVQDEILKMQDLDADEQEMYSKIGSFMEGIQHHIGEIRAERGDDFVIGQVDGPTRNRSVESLRTGAEALLEGLHQSKRGPVEKFFTACLNKASEAINTVCAAYKGWQEGRAAAKEEKEQKKFEALKDKFSSKEDELGGAPTMGGGDDKSGE